MAARRPPLTFGTVASHLGVLIAVSAVMGVLAAGLAVPLVSALGYGAHQIDTSLRNLPEDLKAEPLAQRTRVLGSNGGLIATFYDQNRVNVPLDQVSKIMQRSIVGVEDYRFYQHGALDLKGTLRAFLNNQTGDGSTQGGSSITQQMAKMTALNQAQTPAERRAAVADTYKRKILELRHAIAFEQNYSKDWILDRYLNIAYFGDGAYGIQAAARHYFSVDAKDLNAKQSALLAGLVKNPSGYAPTEYPARAKARRHVVLDRLAQLKIISQQKADKIDAGGLGLKVSPTPNGCVSSKAPFFCDYVRRYLLDDPSLGKTVDDRKELLNSGGLTIKTTLRLPFERAALRATHDAVRPTDHAVGALAMVQPGSGDVLAISQSKPMGRSKAKGETFLNHVVDQKYGDAAGFQPGSTFKLFVLSAALTQGLAPHATRFFAPDQAHIPQNEFRTCKGPYPNVATWDPHNSTLSHTTMDMYVGMQQSVNTYFAQLERQTGLCMPVKLAKAMGVQLPSNAQVPSFTLGVADANPLEMAAAYATMPARGKYCSPRPVTEILNSSGQVFKKYPTHCKQVVSREVADRINDILRGVMLPGGFGVGLALDKPSAGKTGTSQDNKAVWFNGYTPEVSASSVVAGVNGQGFPSTLNGVSLNGLVRSTAHGSTVAGPMWAEAMRAIQDRIPYKNFERPSNPPPTTGLPQVLGSSVASAESTIRADGFHPQLAGELDSHYPAGSVAFISRGVDGRTVYLYTSTGHGGPAPPPPPTPHHHAPAPHPGGGGGGAAPAGGGGPGHGHGRGHGHGH
ncbi:transglycosylase domain-containing protein [Nocardioides terrisoli]|uniref:transglycosylase domain-containing protein n=1 Tax=Nocardioides terrisoli TaxID=3388267 RepID=UPI00287B962B|nr:transglycosylase domain-containing protein [Nocardioides marmorisolisilvae]